ncbi:C-C motif chemokine 2-like [Sebastes fasciatus]|uniref:C-C motif chemokine 2-like n=1 Tax=Sebastes fasciatus TaxID=394691 RepID=UPI003D9F70FE
MRLSLVLAALLCFTTWMSVGHATNGPVSSCCLGRSDTKVPFKRILSYTIQTDGVCQITAVVFLTKLGKRICSDPNSDWAKRTILKLDEEKKKEKALQEQGQTEEGLTSDITPTVSTTAIMFQTKRGVGISSDPNSDRAEKDILKVDEEKKEALQEQGQNEQELTSDITPTESTTSKKTPQKKGRHRRRRQKNKSRRWKKAQRKHP